ncbi:hypothetical protein H7F36_02790 [Variovorax sp. PAMC28562]|uniref:helix-turn-helix domain-containing protein n=1 Tax=Variovorax sp. PAMC28562 TaxID=2762323 RepID=UPI00164EC873|nr:helix-turn-helix domain-containing protein [Variovorax sp. PAMC28562]QNK74192.1 hypothetical protein H7F36_02790 [Variovorax sp. PAMC28562]
MKEPMALSRATMGFQNQTSSFDFTANVGVAARRYLTRKEQHKVILSALRHSPKTTDFLRSVGCFQAPTRIHELRAQGYSIDTAMVNAWGADGRTHRMALYTLNEPTDDWVRPAAGSN